MHPPPLLGFFGAHFGAGCKTKFPSAAPGIPAAFPGMWNSPGARAAPGVDLMGFWAGKKLLWNRLGSGGTFWGHPRARIRREGIPKGLLLAAEERLGKALG